RDVGAGRRGDEPVPLRERRERRIAGAHLRIPRAEADRHINDRQPGGADGGAELGGPRQRRGGPVAEHRDHLGLKIHQQEGGAAAIDGEHVTPWLGWRQPTRSRATSSLRWRVRDARAHRLRAPPAAWAFRSPLSWNLTLAPREESSARVAWLARQPRSRLPALARSPHCKLEDDA